ncbi:MAG: hypothetical protein ACUVRY_10170 [Thermoanaerobaculaceae bacterium]
MAHLFFGKGGGHARLALLVFWVSLPLLAGEPEPREGLTLNPQRVVCPDLRVSYEPSTHWTTNWYLHAAKQISERRWLALVEQSVSRLGPWTDEAQVAKEAKEKGVVKTAKIEIKKEALFLAEVGASGKILRRSQELPLFPGAPGWGVQFRVFWSLLYMEDNPSCPYSAILGGEPARFVCFDWQLAVVNEVTLPMEEVTGAQGVGFGEEQAFLVLGGCRWDRETVAKGAVLALEVKGKQGGQPLLLASLSLEEHVLRRLGSSPKNPLKLKEILLLPVEERAAGTPVPVVVQAKVEDASGRKSWRFFRGQLGSNALDLTGMLPVWLQEREGIEQTFLFDSSGELQVPLGSTISLSQAFPGDSGQVSLVFLLSYPESEKSEMYRAVNVFARVTEKSVLQLDWINLRAKGDPAYEGKLTVGDSRLLVFPKLLGKGEKNMIFAANLLNDEEPACAVSFALP